MISDAFSKQMEMRIHHFAGFSQSILTKIFVIPKQIHSSIKQEFSSYSMEIIDDRNTDYNNERFCLVSELNCCRISQFSSQGKHFRGGPCYSPD